MIILQFMIFLHICAFFYDIKSKNKVYECTSKFWSLPKKKRKSKIIASFDYLRLIVVVPPYLGSPYFLSFLFLLLDFSFNESLIWASEEKNFTKGEFFYYYPFPLFCFSIFILMHNEVILISWKIAMFYVMFAFVLKISILVTFDYYITKSTSSG